MIARSVLRRVVGSRLAPRHGQVIRSFTEKNHPKPQADGQDDKVRSGVSDPNSSTHGFDPLKPRKPLSRVALGDPESSKARISRGTNAPSSRSIWLGAAILIVGGGGLTWLFKREKRRIEIRRMEREHQGVGKPRIGGPFELVDQNGNKFTDEDLKGKFSMIYFGFSLCPDICPEELEVMTYVINKANTNGQKQLQPLFVTCDPWRDTPEVLKEYLKDFHPDIIGLTGTYDQIKNICKQYRVYFSTPPNVKPTDNYLVDHSIFFYLMDPEGNFIDVLGRNYTGPEAATKVKGHIDAWRPTGSDDRSWFQKLFS